MRFAIPTGNEAGLAAPIAGHFARARYYTVVDDTDGTRICMRVERGEGGGKGRRLSGLFRDWEVDTVLCGALGSGAVRHLEGAGLRVFCGASGAAGDAIDAYRAGLLRSANATTVCSGECRGDDPADSVR